MEMIEIAAFFKEWFAQVFRVLELELPVFHVSIWKFWVGAFCITMSLKVIRMWLWSDALAAHSGNSIEKEYIPHYGLHAGNQRRD